jgi:hypothetical protein
MKKFLFTIIALTLGVTQMNAQSLSVANMDIPEKGQAKVVFKYETGGKTIVQYGFKIELPEGLSWVMDTENENNPAVTLEDGKGFNLNYLDGNFTFLPSSPSTEVKGTDGNLLAMTLKADETAKQDDVFTIKVTNVLFSEKDSEGHLLDVPLDDFEFTVTVVEDRVIFDETDTELPLYTAGTANVRVLRTLKAGQWNTIVLPFNLTKGIGTALFGADAKFAQFTGFLVDYGDDEENVTPLGVNLQFNTYTLPTRGNLAGGTPILVQTSMDIDTLEYDGVTLVEAPVDVTKEGEYSKKGVFKGTFVKTVIPENGLFINSEKFYYSVGKTNIKGFRGWFMLDEVVGKETDFGAKVTFTVDGEATSIDGIPSYQRITEGVYDLSGRKIQLQDGDLNKLQKGVYIIDGKKVTIK